MKKSWGILAKRILVLGLTVSMVGGTVDVSALTASAQTIQGLTAKTQQEESVQNGQEEKHETTTVTVTGFAALSDSVAEQQLPVGASESDIRLPKALTVTVTKTVTEDSEHVKEDEKQSESGDDTEDGKQTENGADTGNGGEDQSGNESDTGTGKEGQQEDGAGTGNESEGQPENGAGTGNENEGQQENGADTGNENEGQSENGESTGNGNEDQPESGAGAETGSQQSIEENAENAEGIVGRLTDWFFAPMTVYAAEDNSGIAENTGAQSGETTGEVHLTGINWEIDAQESDAPVFDGSKDGFCYVYKPVLPDTDGDGNMLVVGEGVELPAIYVLVGEYGVATLDETFRFKTQPTIEEGKETVLVGYEDDEAPLLSVEVEGVDTAAGTVTYQWYRRWKMPSYSDLSGATEASYQIPTELSVGAHYYYCIATYTDRKSGDVKTIQSDTVTFTVEEGAVEVMLTGGTKHYRTLADALDAVNSAFGRSQQITLRFLEDIDNEPMDSRTLTLHDEKLTIDLNGCEVGYKEDGSWNKDKFHLVFDAQSGGQVIVQDSSTGQSGYLHGALETKKPSLTIESGTYDNLIAVNGTWLHLNGGTSKGKVTIGDTAVDTNGATVCDIKKGTYDKVDVYNNVKLKVYDADIASMQVHHKADAAAEVILSGGYYGEISVSQPSGDAIEVTDLNDTDKKLAIVDMLELGYGFYNDEGDLQEIARTTTSVQNLTVRTATVDQSNAAVRIDVTKTGGSESFYYMTWVQATKALSTDSDKKGQFGSWESVKIVLLKDVKARGDAKEWSVEADVPRNITLCSAGENTYTLTGVLGNNVLLDVTGRGDLMVNLTLENIKLEGGCIKAAKTNLTLNEGASVSSAPEAGSSTIRMDGGELVMNNAWVSTASEDSYAAYLNDCTLRMSDSGKDLTSLKSAYIGNKTVTMVIDANSAGSAGGNKVPAFSGDADGELKIFYTGVNARFTSALQNYKGKSELWYRITLMDGATLADGTENDGVVTTFENQIYGLYWKSVDTNPKVHEIPVGDNVCQYTTSQYGGGGGRWPITKEYPFITMPESSLTLYGHTLGTDGRCNNCGKIDIEEAYKNKKLTIEGLEGRTYDSYPQILSKITWTDENGRERELTAPEYGNGYGTLGFGGEATKNTDPPEAYTVIYKNNVEAYPYKPGDAGFDATKAPQVTITGRHGFTGSITIYFTIGKGEMRLGDFDVCGTKNVQIIYDGKEHKAWNAYAVEFKADEGDKAQFSQLGNEQYIQTCNTTLAMEWFGQSWSDPNQVEYSTDDQKTWIVEKEFGVAGDNEKMYMITDAGEHPFYIKVTNKSCGELISDKLIAKITPRDITEKVIFDDPGDITVYYTGKPIIPTAWDEKLVDKELKDENEEAYKLVRDKDFIITAENNTDISTSGIGGTFATAKIIGTGNYTGELPVNFQIKSAFTLKQTTISTNRWYTNNDTYWTNDGVPVTFSEGNVTDGSGLTLLLMRNIVYRASREEGADLGDKVEFYTSLENAVAGTNPGYAFKKEGSNTVRLWGKDPVTGYISEPVDVTLKIDTTAPTWTDKDGNEGEYGIKIQENWWRKLLNTVSFGLFYNNNTLEIKIKANDEKNGVNEVSGFETTSSYPAYYCYVQKVDENVAGSEVSVKTKEDLKDLPDGTTADIKKGFIRVSPANGVGTVKDALKDDGNYIVYAYAVDAAGNRSDYISTEGIVVDANAPTVQVTAPTKEDGTLKDTEATLKVNLSEDATLMWFFVSEGEFKEGDSYTYEECKTDIEKYMNGDPKYPQFAVQKDGKWEVKESEDGTGWEYNEAAGVSYAQRWIREHPGNTVEKGPTYRPAIFKVQGTKGDNVIKIGDFGQPDIFYPLYPSKKTAVWIAAIDKAGNMTALTKPATEFTTTKAMPKVTTLPVVSGVYGDTTANLKVTQEGVAKYGEDTITGTWSVSGKTGDTYIWQIKDTEKCLVTFTPDATIYGDTYEATVVEVTPTIAPRPITIKVENMHRTYGDPFPGMEKLKFEIVGGTSLAAGDTETDFWKELDFRADAEATKLDGAAGVWMFWIEEASTSGNYSIKVEGYYDNINDPATVTKECGFLYTDKAQGEFVKLEGYQDRWSVAYGDAPFSLAVKTNNVHYHLAEYTVTDAKDAAGNDIDKADIATKLLSVSREGEVTIKGAGSAKITILYPKDINYTEATPLTVDVNIAQANSKAPVIYRDYLFLRGGSDSIDLAELLPKDCGEVTYGAVTTSDSKSILKGTPTLSQDGKLSYAVKAGGTVGDEATITVSVSTANYTINNGYGIKVEIKLIDQLPIQPKGSISLKTDTLTYGEALSSLQFNSVTFADKATGKTVLGKLSFDEPDKKLDAGQYQEKWTFTPTDDAYAKYVGSIAVTVKKAKPKLTAVPVPGDCIYNPCLALSTIYLNEWAKTNGTVTGVDGLWVYGEWKFVDPTVITKYMKVGSENYAIYFEPSQEYEKNYDCTDIKANVTITIKKAKPYISDVNPGVYTHDDYLYNKPLTGTVLTGNGKGDPGNGGTETEQPVSGTFTWKTPSTKLSHVESNGKTYEYIFTPNDTTSYEIVTGSVAVTVNKAQNPAVMPGSTMNVANSCEKVSSVKLPAGWAWNTTDAETALSVGTPVSATAEYTAADKNNYENTTVTVQITRSSCEHKTTKVEKVIPATCSKEGSTGQVVCEDCGAVVETASATAKDPANHTALTETVVRAATTSQTGLRVSDCTACGYHAEVTIPKLSGGSTGGNSGNGGSVPQPETTGDNAGAGNQNTVGGSDNGNSNGSTGGGQGAATTPVSPKPQTPAPQPEETRPGNTPQDRTNPADGGKQTADTAEPFIKGENGKEGWEVIHNEVTAAKEGETVSVDMNGATTVPGDILSQISGKDITLVLDMGNGITWSINGMSFTGGEVGDIDFGVTYGEQAGTNIPVDVINNVTGERYSMNLTLAYDGEFGFSAVLSINMDGKNAGLYANLFYYNPESGELEFICAGQIGEDGNAELTFTHASDYTIVIDTEPMDQADAGDAVEAADTDKTPDTDNAGTIEPAKEDTHTAAGWIILIVVILAVAAAAGGVVLQKRRRQK